MTRDLKMIAEGIYIGYRDRKSIIETLNDSIDSISDGLRSPVSDGQPRAAGGVSDSVSRAVEKIDDIARRRDAEQTRVNAVDFAVEDTLSLYSEDLQPVMRKAIDLSIRHKKFECDDFIADSDIRPGTVRHAKYEVLRKILVYLMYL